MKEIRIITLLFLAILAVTVCCKQTTDSDDPKSDDWPFDPPSDTPLDAFVMNEKIGRGFNLGNALEAPSEGEWGMVIKDEYLKIIADAGFNSIRLPVTWSAHTLERAPYLIDSTFFNRVDHIVQTALGNGLIVVLNNHHFDPLNNDPVGNRDWLLSIWEQVADHYKNYPDELFFEILNEPHGAFNDNASLWHDLAKGALELIRKTNPYRMVVIGPVSWNSIHQLHGLIIPADEDGIIVTYHYYEPFHFTHQGASWAGDQANSWLGTTWMGSQNERNEINKAFDAAADWARQHGRPLYMGEFGAYSAADMNSRYRWTDYVARAAEKRGISWSYWEFGAGFGAFDRDTGKWRELLLKALMPEE